MTCQDPTSSPDADGFTAVRKPCARIITKQEGVATPHSRLLTSPDCFLTITLDMLATPADIAVALADAHVDQSTLDTDWGGDGSGLLAQGPAIALTVKLGVWDCHSLVPRPQHASSAA